MRVSDYDHAVTIAFKKSIMRFSEAPEAKFDPLVRLRDKKILHVSFTPDQWMIMETKLGRHISATEISELILGVFLGEFKIVKR